MNTAQPVETDADLLPEPCLNGEYEYPDGSVIWYRKSDGSCRAFGPLGSGYSSEHVSSPSDAARALAAAGYGPPSLKKAEKPPVSNSATTRAAVDHLVGIATERNALRQEVEALRAIVSKLPKVWRLNEAGELVQDVPSSPGLMVYERVGGATISGEVRCLECPKDKEAWIGYGETRLRHVPAEYLSTSPEAAEALAERGAGKGEEEKR